MFLFNANKSYNIRKIRGIVKNFILIVMYISFQVSNIRGIHYHVASALGLLPAQLINIYLGSSLRSMQDVLEDKSTAVTGYMVFCFQVIIYLFYFFVYSNSSNFNLRNFKNYLFEYFTDTNWSISDGLRGAKGA